MKPVKRKRSMRMEVIENGKPVPKEMQSAVLLDMSDRFRARQLHRRAERASYRHRHSPERQSVALAMLAVERAIVEAYWILGRSTSNPVPRQSRQHGVGYMLEREDKWGAAVASGGWLSEEPPITGPTAAEIDWMDGPLEWLQLLDDLHRAVVSSGARSKEGEVERRVNWSRVRLHHPTLGDWTSDRLGRLYNEGLRIIAMERSHAA
jgi:hypothetical protein